MICLVSPSLPIRRMITTKNANIMAAMELRGPLTTSIDTVGLVRQVHVWTATDSPSEAYAFLSHLSEVAEHGALELHLSPVHGLEGWLGLRFGYVRAFSSWHRTGIAPKLRSTR